MSPYGEKPHRGHREKSGNNGKLANVYVYVKDGLGNKVYAAPMDAGGA